MVQEYYNNDLANNLKTNHLELTFQPTYMRHPHIITFPYRVQDTEDADWVRVFPSTSKAPKRAAWEPKLNLERLDDEDEGDRPARRPRVNQIWRQAPPVPRGWHMDAILETANRMETDAPRSMFESWVIPTPLSASRDAMACDIPTVHPTPFDGSAPVVQSTPVDTLATGVPVVEAAVDAPMLQPPALHTGPPKTKAGRKPRAVEGSLLRPDGTSESSDVTMLT